MEIWISHITSLKCKKLEILELSGVRVKITNTVCNFCSSLACEILKKSLPEHLECCH